MKRQDDQPVGWAISDDMVEYASAEAIMKNRAAQIAAGEAQEIVWLLEHPPLYTAGTSAKSDDLLTPDRFPVHHVGRGGQYTYHGPGQRVGYVMLNLKERSQDVRAFVRDLEQWLIETLAEFNIKGERREGRVGIWVERDTRITNGPEDKIAALGIRLHKWVSYHGVSLNISPDLEHFSGIIPCGIQEHGVTSFEQLGHIATMADVDIALRTCFERVFGATTSKAPPAILQTTS